MSKTAYQELMSLSRRAANAPESQRIAIGQSFDNVISANFGTEFGAEGWQSFSQNNGSYVKMSEQSALTISTFFACIRVIAEDCAKLPLKVFSRERVKNRPFKTYVDDDFTRVLSIAPNPRITAYDFWKWYIGSIVGWGGSFAKKEFSAFGDLIGLYPIHPSRVQLLVNKNQTFSFKVWNNDGTSQIFTEDQMFYCVDMSIDGYVGYSTIELMQNTLSRSNSTDRYARHFFTNNGRPTGALITDESLSPAARNNIRDSWAEIYSGPNNAGKTAVLDRGIKYQAFSAPFKDLEFVAQWAFNREQICEWFRVNPRKVGVQTNAKGWATIDADETAHFNDTLMPRLVGIEQNIRRQLFPIWYAPNIECEFDADYVLRGDVKTRTEKNEKMFMCGSLSPNMWLESEGENPVDKPEMDEFYVQGAMIPLKLAGKVAMQKTVSDPSGNNPSGK